MATFIIINMTDLISFRFLANWTSQTTKILTMAEERQGVCVGEENMVELDTEFLKKLEEEAKDRFTEDDKNFMEVSESTFNCHFFSHAYANLIFP